MILEGLVTTLNADDSLNIAPMGPRVDAAMQQIVLRPYPTSQTYQNLKRSGQGVLHVVDDVWLLARAAIGPVEPLPPLRPAEKIDGRVLLSACRWYEFEVRRWDDSPQPPHCHVEVVHRGWLRDFFGFNRAKHAVVEAAILATRTALLPHEQIAAEFERLAVLVEKTGGEQERRAFDFLKNRLAPPPAPTV